MAFLREGVMGLMPCRWCSCNAPKATVICPDCRNVLEKFRELWRYGGLRSLWRGANNPEDVLSQFIELCVLADASPREAANLESLIIHSHPILG
jgi:hypothetical protein